MISIKVKGLCVVAVWLGIVLLSTLAPVSPRVASAAQLGTFSVQQESSGSWAEVFSAPFGVTYETKSFPVHPDSGSVRVRIAESGMPFADVDSIALSACGVRVAPEYARYVSTGENVLPWVQADDLDVIVVHEKPIEVLWRLPEGCAGQAILSVNANAYESFEENAFFFPKRGSSDVRYDFLNNGSLAVDGLIPEVDGVAEPNHQILWTPTTGHPTATTSVYMRDDATSVYLSFDIVADNTDDFGADWLKVFASNPASGVVAEYRVDDANPLNGACAFGTTTRASYRHQTCEVRIPKSEISGDFLDFSVRYYGTGSFQEALSAQGNITSADDDASPEFTITATFVNTTVATSSIAILDEAGLNTIVPATACSAQDGAYDESPEVVVCSVGQNLAIGTTYRLLFSATGADGGYYQYSGANKFVLGESFVRVLRGGFDDQSGYNFQGHPLVYEGRIYFVATSGGLNSSGGIFSMALDGSDLQTLHSFDYSFEGTGFAGLIELDGVLFGATTNGAGNYYTGSLYSINPDGTNFQRIRGWGFDDGFVLYGDIYTHGGKIRGIQRDISPGGVIFFSVNPDGSGFEFSHHSYDPVIGPLLPYQGRLYGVLNSPVRIFSVDLDGADLDILYTVDATQSNGTLREHGGKLYGTSLNGNNSQFGLYSLDPDGSNFTFLISSSTEYASDLVFAGNSIYSSADRNLNVYDAEIGEFRTIGTYNYLTSSDVSKSFESSISAHDGYGYSLGISGVSVFPLPYLTYSAGPNGLISGSTTQALDYNGSGTEVTAVPDSGHRFVSWSDGVTTASRTDSNVTRRVSVTATFETIPAVVAPIVETRRSKSGGGSGRRSAVPVSPVVTTVAPQVPVPPAGAPVGALSGVIATSGFSWNLSVGSSGYDVRALQAFLNSRGFVVSDSGPGSPGLETEFFGPRTRDALAKFQASVGISPALGFFGPVTRAYVQTGR